MSQSFTSSNDSVPKVSLKELCYSGQPFHSLSRTAFIDQFRCLNDKSPDIQKEMRPMTAFPYIHLVLSLFEEFEQFLTARREADVDENHPLTQDDPSYSRILSAYRRGVSICEEDLPPILAHFGGKTSSGVLFRETFLSTVEELGLLIQQTSAVVGDEILKGIVSSGKAIHLLPLDEFTLCFYHATGLDREQSEYRLTFEHPTLSALCDISFDAGQLRHLLLDRFLTTKRSSLEQQRLFDAHSERYRIAADTYHRQIRQETALLGVIDSDTGYHLLLFDVETFDAYLDAYRADVEELERRTAHYRNNL